MKKLNNKKGFTLAELLIVVAIIGVLTVVAVPVFTAQLEKSREATDIANMREAKAAAASAYLSEEKIDDTTQLGSAQEDDEEVWFNVNSGKLTTTKPDAYGKGTATEGSSDNTAYGYSPSTDVTDCCVKVTISRDGDCTVSWES